MTQITQFNKSNLNSMRIDLKLALKKIEDKYGVNVNIGNIRFSDDEFSAPMKVTIEGAETAEEKAVATFSKMETGFKFSAGQRFFSETLGECKIVGFLTRSPKYPWIVETAKGKQYKYTSASLKHELSEMVL